MNAPVSSIGLVFFAIMFLIGFWKWRSSVLVVPFWLLAEGAVRKWVVPDHHIDVYFLKDFLLAGVLCRFILIRMGPSRLSGGIKGLDFHLGLLTFWCVVELFNPVMPSPFLGMMGLKVYVFYAFLLYVMPYVFESKAQLIRYLEVYAWCSIPVLVLGIVQFFSPPGSAITHSLSWGSDDVETYFGGVGLFCTHIRICSSFAYLTEYSGYLNVLALLLLALLQMRQVWKTPFYVIAALTVVNVLMTGSRGLVGVLLISSVLFIFLTGRYSFGKFFQVVMRMSWLIGIASLVLAIKFPEGLTAFMDRFHSEQDIGGRVMVTLEQPLLRLSNAGLFGYGVGTTHQAALFILPGNQDWHGMKRDFEDEYGRVLLELGLVGYLIFYSLRAFLAWVLWRGIHKTQDWDLKVIMVFVFLLNVFFAAEGVLFSHVHLVFYWFFTGFLRLLPELDEKERHPSPLAQENLPEVRFSHAA